MSPALPYTMMWTQSGGLFTILTYNLLTRAINVLGVSDFDIILTKYTLVRKLWNLSLLRSHRTFEHLQRNTVNKNKVSSPADMPSCGPLVFAKGIIGVYCPLGKTKWFSQHNLLIESHVIQPTCFANTQWPSQSQWLCYYNGTPRFCPNKAI